MTDMKTNELDNKIIIYQTDDGKTQLDVKLENETVWLTQAQMAELFQKDRTVIGRHIRAQAQMSVDKDLLEYCANFARVTPRVTPLPKGCM